jgi:putative exbD/tolR family transport protein
MTIEIPKKEPLNIVPFIDIMLVLLAMVLSVSTFIAKGEIPIALPSREARRLPSRIRTRSSFR